MQTLPQGIKDFSKVDRRREEVKLRGLESLNNKQTETQLTFFDILDLSLPEYISAIHPVTMSKKKSLVKNGNRQGLLQIQSRRYLGNKFRLLNFIREIVEKRCEGYRSFCDIFAGTGVVGNEFNHSDVRIISNELLYSNYVSLCAWLSPEQFDRARIAEYIHILNNIRPAKENYVSHYFGGTYFTIENARKIGAVREKIEELDLSFKEKCILLTSLLYAIDKVANTCGHYDAFRRTLDTTTPIKLLVPDIKQDENKQNEIHHEDANRLIRKIRMDVLYIDPPYNSRHYCDSYHLLENIIAWKKPKTFGVAKKMLRSHLKSRYCLKTAPKALDDLISNANCRYIFVSYNNMAGKGDQRSNARIKDEEIIRSLCKRGKIEIFETEFKSFTTGKSKIEGHTERVFFCEVWKGRIWSSAFNELGFATCYKKGNKYVPGGVNVTKAGKALLSGNYVEEDVWLRQLLKVQFPNPLPQKSESQYPQFYLLPFQATLRVIKACNGISKEEGFILNTLRTMTEVDKAVKFIKKYRKGLSRIRKEGRDVTGRHIIQQQCNMAELLHKDEIEERLEYLRIYYKSKKHTKDKELLRMIARSGKGSSTAKAIKLAVELADLKRQGASLKELEKRFLSYYLILKSSSWKDYIDVTARYFRMSGLLTIHRSRINIAEPYGDVVEWILSCKWQLKKKGDYLQYLHNHTLPALPQDKTAYLWQTTEKTLRDVIKLSKATKIQIEPKTVKIDKEITDPLVLRKQLLRLTDMKRELKEYEYMLLLHREVSEIDKIIEYFDSIKHNDILGHRPTHFEWNVWRGFLAIDKLSRFPHKCRNFDIDDDLQPRSNAPGGKPDMVFYYEDYVLVVEVTLSTGETQYSSEYEPVPRHVVRVMEQEKGRDVYSLFIAPQIQINTAIHFYAKMTSVPYINSSGEKVYPKIIPLSLDEYILLLKVFRKKRYLPVQLRNLLNDIIALKDRPDVTDGSDWLNYIKGCVVKWSEKL